MKVKFLSWFPAFFLLVGNIIFAAVSWRFPVISMPALLAAVCEELFFRGLLFKTWLLPRMRPVSAVVLSAALFAALHLINLTNGASYCFVCFQVLFAFCFGIWAGAVVYRQGSILIPLCVHVLINLTGTFAEIFWLDASASALFLLDGLLIASCSDQSEPQCVSVSDVRMF